MATRDRRRRGIEMLDTRCIGKIVSHRAGQSVRDFEMTSIRRVHRTHPPRGARLLPEEVEDGVPGKNIPRLFERNVAETEAQKIGSQQDRRPAEKPLWLEASRGGQRHNGQSQENQCEIHIIGVMQCAQGRAAQ
jgi:hypothetical protein